MHWGWVVAILLAVGVLSGVVAWVSTTEKASERRPAYKAVPSPALGGTFRAECACSGT